MHHHLAHTHRLPPLRYNAYMLASPSKLYEAPPAFPAAKLKFCGAAKEQREKKARNEVETHRQHPHLRSRHQCSSPGCLEQGASLSAIYRAAGVHETPKKTNASEARFKFSRNTGSRARTASDGIEPAAVPRRQCLRIARKQEGKDCCQRRPVWKPRT
jgi:hypothetical protein